MKPAHVLESLMHVLLAHYSHRRDDLEVIGRFGNRFEDWVKWESAVALHRASFCEGVSGIEAIAVERDDCDLFIGPRAWPGGGGYPPAEEGDVWIELKARNTRDKGAAELGAWVQADLDKQRKRKAGKGTGHYAVVALVVAHPEHPLDDDWLATLTRSVKPAGLVLRLYLDKRGAGPGDPLLAALVGWEV